MSYTENNINIKNAKFITHPHKIINIDSLPDLSNNNIKTEVENLLHVLDSKQFQVFAVNVMNSDLEIPAFYTIIPGAHFRERASALPILTLTRANPV